MKKEVLKSGLLTEKGDFRQLFSACIGKAYVNQLAFGEQVVKDKDWFIDLKEGFIRFGQDVYPMQLLGSESYISNTWLWGWANSSGFSSEVLREAIFLKEIGEECDYKEFAEAEMELGDLQGGHVYSSIAAMLSDGNTCYYRCPYDGGAAFVLVKDIPDSVSAPVDLQAFVQAIQQLIRQFELNHRVLVKGWFLQDGIVYREEENLIVAEFDGSQVLEIKFDALDRITGINASLK